MKDMTTTEYEILSLLDHASGKSLKFIELRDTLKHKNITSMNVSDAINYRLRRNELVVEIGCGQMYQRLWAITPKGTQLMRRETERRKQAERKEAARQQDVLRQAAARVDRQAKGVVLNYTELKPDGIWAARLTSNVVSVVREIENVKPTEIFRKGVASFVFVLPSRQQMEAELTTVGVFPSKEQAFGACARILEDNNLGQTYIVITKMDMVREVELDYVQ